MSIAKKACWCHRDGLRTSHGTPAPIVGLGAGVPASVLVSVVARPRPTTAERWRKDAEVSGETEILVRRRDQHGELLQRLYLDG